MQALQKNAQTCIAVPGGTTPGAYLQALAREPLPWSRIAFLLTDERWTSDDNPRSNFRLLRASLGQVADQAQLLPFYREGLDHNQAQKPLGMAVKHLFAEAVPSVCVLGMGEDGHFASLFPGNPLLEEGLTTLHRVLAVEHLGEARLSLTLAAINSFQHVALLIQGAAKRDVLAEAIAGKRPELPIAHLLNSCELEVYQA